MSNRPDKRSRKKALDRWKAGQRAIAYSKLPLLVEQMKALFDRLDDEFAVKGCDHSLRLTRSWLQTMDLPVDDVVAWLHDNGSFCDCEVLANAEQAWRDAIKGKRSPAR